MCCCQAGGSVVVAGTRRFCLARRVCPMLVLPPALTLLLTVYFFGRRQASTSARLVRSTARWCDAPVGLGRAMIDDPVYPAPSRHRPGRSACPTRFSPDLYSALLEAGAVHKHVECVHRALKGAVVGGRPASGTVRRESTRSLV